MTRDLTIDQARGARILFLRTAPRLVDIASHRIASVDAGPPRALVRPNQAINQTRQEPLAMNGSQTILLHTIANQRNEELRSAAQRDRLFAEVGRQNGIPTPIERARRVVGNVLVRTGNLVGGERGERQPTERVAGVTVLRTAR
jgi:hypothetical protein